MLFILKPKLFRAQTADSQPGPEPLISTSRFFIPNSFATSPAFSTATCTTKSVLLQKPQNPQPPNITHKNTLP
jgi:hypothetical protein